MWNRGVVFLEDGRGGSRGSRLLTQKCGSCISSMLSPGLMPWSHYTASRLVIGSLAHQRDWSAAEGVTHYKSNMRDVTQMWSELFVFWFAVGGKDYSSIQNVWLPARVVVQQWQGYKHWKACVCVCRCVLMENRLLFPSLYKHRRKKTEFRELRGGERRGVFALIGCASFMAPQPGRYSVCWISISISELWIIHWTLHTWQPSSSDPGPSPADVQKNCGREKKKRAKIQLSELSLKQNKWLEG